MLPSRRRPRSAVERGFVRLVATTGVVGIGVLLGAVLSSNKVQGWITGLVISLVSVILAGLLWSSRQL
jgi:protein-S-isoprenylcysteine O-methyltransferase Ste14